MAKTKTVDGITIQKNSYGMVNFKEIEKISKHLIDIMYLVFNCNSYSIFVNVWDDYTFRVECRYAEVINDKQCKLHIYEWYKGEINYTNSIVNNIR